MPKVVLDTNVWVGVLLSSRTCRALRDAFLEAQFELIVSVDLMEELVRTCRKPRLSSIFRSDDVEELLELLKTDAEWVSPKVKVSVCRDPDDNSVLECAVAGQADFVVTGDKDLLVLKTFRKISIVNPREFLNILSE